MKMTSSGFWFIQQGFRGGRLADAHVPGFVPRADAHGVGDPQVVGRPRDVVDVQVDLPKAEVELVGDRVRVLEERE